jgi:phosphatidylglycerophosphate synthase
MYTNLADPAHTENPLPDRTTNQAAINQPARNEFVMALLSDLQRGRYTPLAWWRFLADAWKKSWETSRAYPSLTRSWASVTGFIALLGMGGWAAIWLVEGKQLALQILPALLLCLLLQQGDVYVHLGLNLDPIDGRFRERLGLPTTLTLMRGVMANLLLAQLLSGRIPLASVVLTAYLIGIATDIADGQIARRTGWLTRLGGNLDSEADLFLYTSTTLCALLLGNLPGWLALAMLLRFLVPLSGALFSYFVAIRQVDFSHSTWGRSAGLAQAICLVIVLLPAALARLLSPILLPLMLVTLALLVLAPIIDVKRNLSFWRTQKSRIEDAA